MKKLKNILLILSLTAIVGCGETSAQPSSFEPQIINRQARTEIPEVSFSDVNKSGDYLYYLLQEGDNIHLKKRDLATEAEELIRIIPYNGAILNFAISADERFFAFTGKEADKVIVYTTEVNSGGPLVNMQETSAISRYYNTRELTSEDFLLKRVGLKDKFLFKEPSLDCGGLIFNHMSWSGAYICDSATEIMPDEQVMIVDYNYEENNSNMVLATTEYGTYEPKEILELPLGADDVKNLELLNEKTVRITTADEYIDVQFAE